MSPKTHWYCFEIAVVLSCSHPLNFYSWAQCVIDIWYTYHIWKVSQNTLRISVCPKQCKSWIHKWLQNTLRLSVCYGDNYVFELYISKNTMKFSVCFGDIWNMLFRNVSHNTLRDIIDQCVKCVECVMENFPWEL